MYYKIIFSCATPTLSLKLFFISAKDRVNVNIFTVALFVASMSEPRNIVPHQFDGTRKERQMKYPKIVEASKKFLIGEHGRQLQTVTLCEIKESF